VVDAGAGAVHGWKEGGVAEDFEPVVELVERLGFEPGDVAAPDDEVNVLGDEGALGGIGEFG